MGKHETSYARVTRDLYPTRERWVTEALLAHVQLAEMTVWEPAAGRGDLVTALRDSGARIVASDIADYGFPLDALLDFTTGQVPPAPFEIIITNPPAGRATRRPKRSSSPGSSISATECACWRYCCRSISTARRDAVHSSPNAPRLQPRSC